MMALLNELIVLIDLVMYQFKLIFFYWLAGLIAGSLVSVFISGRIGNKVISLDSSRYGLAAVIPAALLGAASPLCMYGTIPLIASLGRKGVPQHLLAAFMVSSILINPNLFIFSFALGMPMALLRLFLCILAGVLSGLLVRLLYRNKRLFDFNGFEDKCKSSPNTNTVIWLLADMHRAVIKTAPYFLTGIVLTAIFDRYFPQDLLVSLFEFNRSVGVLLAASLGVPVYVCGGGTIPLLKAWLDAGMSPGEAAAFMITGPATKITNLSAVKIILGLRNFMMYIAFNFGFSVIAGLIVDLVIKL